MKIPVILISIGFVLSLHGTAFGGSDFRSTDLSGYEVFTEGFPRTLLFRKSAIVNWDERGILDQHLGMFDADTRKYVGEETPFKQDWIDLMAAFKERHPKKLSLIHLNGEARGVYRKEGHRYFPGHWILYPGETLTHELSAQDQILKVGNPEIFSSRTYHKRERGELTELLMPPVIIVPLGPDGEKIWARSEYADIIEINGEDKTLTLHRGRYFSEAREFSANRAYIAPIHCEYWGAGTMWTLNLSSVCPRDPQGRTAGDIWLEEIKEWCRPGGLAEHVDGIGFDVIFYKAKNDAWDIDADGVSDGGVDASGFDFSTYGQHQLLKRLRDEVGPEFILTSDSWGHRMQRAVGIFNGMESEGLCMWNDGWRKIAQTINTHRYWAQQGNAKYNYSYITSKLRHPEDMEIADQLYRMGLGTACALGVSYTEAAIPRRKDGLPMIPEMHRGQAEEPNWLGQPTGEMILTPQYRPDLCEGNWEAFSPELASQVQTKNCQVRVGDDGSLLIQGTAGNPYEDMEVTFPVIQVSGGDLSIFFEALALEPLEGYDPEDRIPRQIFVHADGMPPTPPDQRGGRPMYNDIMALMGTHSWQENYAYFRKAGEGSGNILITLRIENQGDCKIRRLTAHHGPLGIIREFENGVVMVNASQEEMVFNLPGTFPEAHSQGLWRIKADPGAYVPSLEAAKMLKIHTGAKIEVPYLELPPLEALFLSKSPQ